MVFLILILLSSVLFLILAVPARRAGRKAAPSPRHAASPRAASPRHTDAGTYLPRLILGCIWFYCLFSFFLFALLHCVLPYLRWLKIDIFLFILFSLMALAINIVDCLTVFISNRDCRQSVIWWACIRDKFMNSCSLWVICVFFCHWSLSA